MTLEDGRKKGTGWGGKREWTRKEERRNESGIRERV